MEMTVLLRQDAHGDMMPAIVRDDVLASEAALSEATGAFTLAQVLAHMGLEARTIDMYGSSMLRAVWALQRITTMKGGPWSDLARETLGELAAGGDFDDHIIPVPQEASHTGFLPEPVKWDGISFGWGS